MGEGVTFVRANAFYQHRNIVEVICHDKVEKIEQRAFENCPSLRRVIMPGVKVVEESAFWKCEALTDVECGKLEIVGEWAFGGGCIILKSINLPSARIVEEYAFAECGLLNVKYGNKLERFKDCAFCYNHSLERITIPLKDGLIAEDNIFQGCDQLNNVHLLESAELHETITALHLEEWRNDMNDQIDSINRNLPDANEEEEDGEKARVIRRWIRSILSKISHYQEEHQRILDEVPPALKFALPRDIVMNNVLSFLKLPSHTFDEEDEDEEELDASY